MEEHNKWQLLKEMLRIIIWLVAGMLTPFAGMMGTILSAATREMNCSETAFVLPSRQPGADCQVRFFTPSEEVDLCGHATIATFHVLVSEGIVSLTGKETIVRQETKAGVLPVYILSADQRTIDRVIMGQALPQILGTNGDFKKVAELMGLNETDLALNGLPMQVVSTGLPDLMVPVKDLRTLKKASPDFSRLAEYQKSQGFISIHAFTFETEDPTNTVHVRDFAPSVCIDEEAATGTANGALGAYLVANKALPLPPGELLLKVEQGYVMGRPSEILVSIRYAGGVVSDVKVGGRAVTIMEGFFTF